MKVLCFGKTEERVARRCEVLRAAGYSATGVGDYQAAAQAAESTEYDALVLGQQVDEAERNELARKMRRANPDLLIVMLYDGSIRSTELADAILNVRGEAADLVQTLTFLAQRKQIKRSTHASRKMRRSGI